MIFFRNLKIHFRQLLSQKLNSTVHIAGLSIGIAVCLLIGLFVRFELSFDNYHPNVARTYRVNEVWKNNDQVNKHYSTPLALLNALRKNVTGIEHVAVAFPGWNNLIDVGPGKRFEEDQVLITDPEFLDVFSIEAIEGDPRAVLAKPYHALLTESTAKKYYGNENPVGKIFRYRSSFDITVGAVIRDLPANTHLPASIIISYLPDANFLGPSPDEWSFTTGSATYVVLSEGADKTLIEAQLHGLADDHINSNPNLPKNIRADFELASLSEIHFDADAHGSWAVPAVSKTWIWFFGIVGLAVLLLACINFINLSTAQALTRAKEVGIRKTIGAGRMNLLFQFLGEAWILTFISGVIAVGMTQTTLPFVNTLIEKQITFDLTHSPELIASLITGLFITGLFAGIYPAWIITRYNPATSLRTSFFAQGEQTSSWIRHALVVVQFAFSAGLLIALLLISQQVNFIHTRDLGINKDDIVIVKLGNRGKWKFFGDQLEKVPQIEQWSFSNGPATHANHWSTYFTLNGREDLDRKNVTLLMGDEKFDDLYGFKLLAGRFLVDSDTNYLSKALPKEKQVNLCVINEKAMALFGVDKPEKVIGRRFWSSIATENFEVVGVVSDFNANSLHEAIQPLIMTPNPSTYGYASIKLRHDADVASTMTAIEEQWKVAYPDAVFSYSFLDEQINSYYKAEERVFQLFRIAAGLAMLISCLGLFGLITFTAQRRMKEISIRKVLGATSASIVKLLSREFFYMVVIALVIAGPLVYYGITRWLEAFAYHAPIGWQSFVTAGGISIALALITVGVQSLRATLTNPASILKSE
jgi:ABC-type antimicrobial peptide transport system permease subunit